MNPSLFSAREKPPAEKNSVRWAGGAQPRAEVPFLARARVRQLGGADAEPGQAPQAQPVRRHPEGVGVGVDEVPLEGGVAGGLALRGEVEAAVGGGEAGQDVGGEAVVRAQVARHDGALLREPVMGALEAAEVAAAPESPAPRAVAAFGTERALRQQPGAGYRIEGEHAVRRRLHAERLRHAARHGAHGGCAVRAVRVQRAPVEGDLHLPRVRFPGRQSGGEALADHPYRAGRHGAAEPGQAQLQHPLAALGIQVHRRGRGARGVLAAMRVDVGDPRLQGVPGVGRDRLVAGARWRPRCRSRRRPAPAAGAIASAGRAARRPGPPAAPSPPLRPAAARWTASPVSAVVRVGDGHPHLQCQRRAAVRRRRGDRQQVFPGALGVFAGADVAEQAVGGAEGEA